MHTRHCLGQDRSDPRGAAWMVQPSSHWFGKKAATPLPAPVPRPICPMGTSEQNSDGICLLLNLLCENSESVLAQSSAQLWTVQNFGVPPASKTLSLIFLSISKANWSSSIHVWKTNVKMHKVISWGGKKSAVWRKENQPSLKVNARFHWNAQNVSFFCYG